MLHMNENKESVKMELQKVLHSTIEKGQGTVARTLNKLPSIAQNGIVKALGYPFNYPELDSMTRLLMAVKYKQGQLGFVQANIEKSRQEFENNMRSITAKRTPVKQIEDLKLSLNSGTIFARHYHPAPNKKLPMLVFFHGGGFVVGSVDSHDEACRIISTTAKVQLLSIDYPLAPEVSPSTLIRSCEDAVAWVFQNSRKFKIYKNKIAVAGDSAGGNIATVVSQRLAKTNYAPQAQFLIYPVVDFKSRHPSFYAYKDGLVLTESDVDLVTEMYATRHQVALDDPLISPTYGKLNDLAPAFVVTAGHDVLHDEGEIYFHKLRQKGVITHFEEYSTQSHGFINLTPVSSTAKHDLEKMTKSFMKFWTKLR